MKSYTRMKPFIALLLAVCVVLASPGMALPQATTATTPATTQATTPAAKTPASPAKVPPGGDPWPRNFTYQAAKISVYQPELSDWTGNKLDAYSAVIIRTGTDKTDFGVIWYTARTEVDKVNRVVTLEDFQLTKQNFPTIANNGAAYTGAFKKDMTWTQSVPLDELQSSLAVTSVAEKQQKVVVQNNPPAIFFSTAPAVLALIDGQPVMKDEGHGLQKIMNTRALILFDSSKNMYYLALMDGWVQSQTFQGDWLMAKHDPEKDLDKIKQAALQANENQVLGNPEQSLKEAFENFQAPQVYVSTTPAELILASGQPEFTPIAGTNLMYVINSGDDIFQDVVNAAYYILVAGRWFSSTNLQNGPWSYIAASSLPADFAKIPPYSPKASVLVSIPGTPQAKEALIANQIPQTATINRAKAKLTLSYVGEPQFSAGDRHFAELRRKFHHAGGDGFRDVLLFLPGWRVVHGNFGERAVGRCDHRAAGDLHHSAQLADLLRHLRASVRLHAELCVCGVYAGLLRHGSFRGRRSRLRHGICVLAVRYQRRVDPGAGNLWRGRVIRMERCGRLGARLWSGHGGGCCVQSVVGASGLVRMGRGGAGVGLGRIRRCGFREFLRPLGQRSLQRHARGVGESLHRKHRGGNSRKFLQSRHRRVRRGRQRLQLQRVHGELRSRQPWRRIQSEYGSSGRRRARSCRQCLQRLVRHRQSRLRLQHAHGEWRRIQ